MAKGEARFSSEGRDVVRFDNTPIPRNVYDLPLEKEGLEVKKSEEKGPDAIPYVNCRFRAQGTAPKEGQKDRLVFHKFFLSLKEGSDGVIMPMRGGGIVEFCRAHGDEADFSVKTITKEDKSTEDYLDSEEVLSYLQSKIGENSRALVIIEAAKDRAGNAIPKHPGNNKIAHWELAEGEMTGTPAKVEPAKTNGKPLPAKKK